MLWIFYSIKNFSRSFFCNVWVCEANKSNNGRVSKILHSNSLVPPSSKLSYKSLSIEFSPSFTSWQFNLPNYSFRLFLLSSEERGIIHNMIRVKVYRKTKKYSPSIRHCMRSFVSCEFVCARVKQNMTTMKLKQTKAHINKLCFFSGSGEQASIHQQCLSCFAARKCCAKGFSILG